MQTPVMMIHGMSCTGSVWTGFKTVFEQRGARVYTPTIRPEQRVSLSGRPHHGLRELRFDHYVEDMEREALRIETETGKKPAVIGHSMGGLLAQALAERGLVSAAVFVTPAAPAGIGDLRTRILWTAIGMAYTLRVGPWAIRPKLSSLERSVFNVLPAAEREAAHAAMVYESGHAFRQLANWPIDETKIAVPTLTIGALGDRLIPARLVRLTANKYAAVGGEFREYEDHGHWMYSEPGWEKRADEIYQWLAAATGEARASTATPVA